MPRHYSYPINDERELLLDKLASELESSSKSKLLDAALLNLEDTIRNHDEFDGDPNIAKEFNTRIVRSYYRTSVELRDP